MLYRVGFDGTFTGLVALVSRYFLHPTKAFFNRKFSGVLKNIFSRAFFKKGNRQTVFSVYLYSFYPPELKPGLNGTVTNGEHKPCRRNDVKFDEFIIIRFALVHGGSVKLLCDCEKLLAIFFPSPKLNGLIYIIEVIKTF